MDMVMNWLKSIDQIIFNQIDLFKNTKYYEQFMDFMNQLSDDQQRLVTYVISAIFILGPLLVVGIIGLNTYTLKSNLNTKKEIQATTYKFINQADRLQSLQQTILGPRAPGSQNELKASLNAFNIDPNKLSVDNFKQESSHNSPQIKQISADIIYKQLVLSDFVDLVKKLITINKVRISAIEINRDDSEKLLSGRINILQYAKK
ncbi:MAG: hypothetical protein A2381_11875 [Bdellovibrionales bacterium RIFOXYB1_FULL_37_110]|nr:MAG: hypothetical protein A2181_05940 [Bdellovibrionales bacterium RIFOXYA1_FULL_38_20]OFZ49254.1 MAG: hypothetical protein A2417_17115 [Bdellovibrionales bacterium RIFOXYC1_FULL_37_79]OFZ58502.1 MAG: hypothetical protein A2381_11875 [Bdellovibrionales bacterium RIFOXYB1_FULL_37_110]OFZ61515.1 MAG: hypothetical protein A2577_00395 [Bdellovibrionales bacterium RIFOXYD1_FULL_36_51]